MSRWQRFKLEHRERFDLIAAWWWRQWFRLRTGSSVSWVAVLRTLVQLVMACLFLYLGPLRWSFELSMRGVSVGEAIGISAWAFANLLAAIGYAGWLFPIHRPHRRR